MKSFGIIAASALFGALVNAAPVHKRDMVWVTETDIDVITIPVTTTVWVDGGATSTESAAPTTTLQADFFHPSLYPASSTTAAPVETSTSTSSSVYVAPTTSSTSVYVAPTTTSSTSVYVAPTTTSTSVYVAPTSSSSTSTYVAPTTTFSSVVVAPTTTEAPTSTYVAPTTTSSTAAAATTTSSGSGSTGLAAPGTTYTGDMTWYEVGLGSCGLTSTASDPIVAISHIIMDAYYTANSNDNPLCGKSVTITGVSGDKYTAKVVDRCVGCAEGDLDLSQDFFNTVTENGDGRVHDITWDWA